MPPAFKKEITATVRAPPMITTAWMVSVTAAPVSPPIVTVRDNKMTPMTPAAVSLIPT